MTFSPLFYALSLLTLLGISGCGSSDNNTSTTPTPSATAAPAPKAETPTASPQRSGGAMLFIPEQIVAFGDVHDYEIRKASVEFINNGDEVLEVVRVQPTCGCTSTTLDQKLFAPGEGATIDLTFSPKGSGQQSKIVKVHTNDSKNPIQFITIKANVKATVTATPRSLSFGTAQLGMGKVGVVILSSQNPTYEPGDPSILGQLNGFTTVDMVETTRPGQTGRTWEITARLSPDTPWGWHTGSLRIVGKVDPPGDAKEKSQYTTVGMNASVQGDLRANDTMFRLLIVKANSPFTKTIRVNRVNGTPFQIIEATVVNGAPESMQVSVVEIPDANGSAYELILTGDSTGHKGSVRGEVKLVTDVPGEEELTLRIAGTVR